MIRKEGIGKKEKTPEKHGILLSSRSAAKGDETWTCSPQYQYVGTLRHFLRAHPTLPIASLMMRLDLPVHFPSI